MIRNRLKITVTSMGARTEETLIQMMSEIVADMRDGGAGVEARREETIL